MKSLFPLSLLNTGGSLSKECHMNLAVWDLGLNIYCWLVVPGGGYGWV